MLLGWQALNRRRLFARRTATGPGNQPPVLSVVAPEGGWVFTTADLINFKATALDPEQGDLSDAITWTSDLLGPIGVGRQFLTQLTEGVHTITVRVEDAGGESDTALIAPLTINAAPPGNDPPTATILAPPSVSNVQEGQLVQFTGAATDPEDGPLTGSALVWTSSRDGQIGTGTSFQRTLSVGSHVITLTATDSGGEVGLDQVVVNVTSAGATFDHYAELPRVTPDRTPPVPTGTAWLVDTAAELHNALANAVPGDEIVLTPGLTYRGKFNLGVKNGTGWILVRSAQLAQLPIGRRVKPSDKPKMPVIQSPGFNDPAIDVQLGAHHWWLAGLYVEADPGSTILNSAIRIGSGSSDQNTYAEIPSFIGVDRCVIVGHATLAGRRGIYNNGRMVVIADCHIDEWHDSADAQAIFFLNGAEGHLIDNCHLAGSGENILAGGGNSWVNGVLPSDITIRRCNIVTPLAWKSTWTIKNIVEFKVGVRVLVEDCILDGCVTDGQTGLALNVKVVNQDDFTVWAATTDITVRYCLIRNAEWLGGIGGDTDAGESGPVLADNITRRVTWRDLLVQGGKAGNRLTQIGLGTVGAPSQITLTRITATDVAWNQFTYLMCPPSQLGQLDVTLCKTTHTGSLPAVLCTGSSGGGCSGQNAACLDSWTRNAGHQWTWAQNVHSGTSVPPGNYNGALAGDPYGAGCNEAEVLAHVAGVETGDFS